MENIESRIKGIITDYVEKVSDQKNAEEKQYAVDVFNNVWENSKKVLSGVQLNDLYKNDKYIKYVTDQGLIILNEDYKSYIDALYNVTEIEYDMVTNITLALDGAFMDKLKTVIGALMVIYEKMTGEKFEC